MEYKVIKSIYGLEEGSVLTYNSNNNKYEYSSDNTDTYGDGQELRIRFDLKINASDVNKLVEEGYLKSTSKLSEAKFIKPTIVKFYEVMEPGVVDVDGTTLIADKGEYILVKSNGNIVRTTKQELFKFFHAI
jgi:hypothetical protein